MLLPAASVKPFAATVKVTFPVALPGGVYVTVLTKPVPLTALKVPPVMVLAEISAALKSVGVSLKVKLRIAVSPDFKLALSLLMVTVGRWVSPVMVRLLLAEPLLPDGSLYAFAATLMLADKLLLASGVNTAVRLEPEPLKLPRLPPVTVTLLVLKLLILSLNVNVIVAVSPALRLALLLAMLNVGGVVSAGVLLPPDVVSPVEGVVGVVVAGVVFVPLTIVPTVALLISDAKVLASL